MKKKGWVFLYCICLTLFLTGCAEAAWSLTDEQLEEVGNYSAGILLKYDAGSRSRLVSDAEIQKYDERQARLEELKKQDEERKQQQNASHNDGEASDGDISVPVTYNELTDFYVLPEGVSISYAGARVLDAYPEDEEYVTASDGKKLLVLGFNLQNQSGQDVFLDFFGLKASYKITVNNRYSKGIFTTILMDDLATYIGTLADGATDQAVLLTEMDASQLENIESVVLKIKAGSQEYNMKLN